MSLHRLDLPTLTAETAWRKYLELRASDKFAATMALITHFKRVDARARSYAMTRRHGFRCFLEHNPLDHTAKGKR